MQSFLATRLSRWLGGVAAVTAAVLVMTAGAWAAGVTYYSQGSVAPEAVGNWNTVRAGGGSAPADFTGGDIFVIQSGHTMPTGAAWTVSGAGSKIQIESGGTLTANNLVAVPAFQVDNGGTYVHNAVSGASNGAAGDVPGSTSRSFGASSTVEFQKWANSGTSPTALPSATWGNLKINVALLAGSWQQSGTLTTIAGNLIIQSTGGTVREFRLNANSPATSTLNLTGDLQVSGGIFNLTSGTAVETFNIGGNFTQSGGTVTATGAGPHTVNFTGGSPAVTFSQSGTLTATSINWTVAGGKTLGLNNALTVATSRTLTVTGTLQVNAGGSVAGAGTVAYAGSGALVYNHTGPFTVGNEWTGTGAVGTGVPASVTMQGAGSLDLPSGTRGTPGGFTQTAGTVNLNAAILELGGSLAVTPSFNSGTGTVRFISGSPVTLSCTSGGVSFASLTVDKPGTSLGLNCDASVSGALTLTAGTVSTGANTLSNVSVVPVTRTSGYVVGSFLKAVSSGASTQTWEIGDATRYTPVTITGTGGGFATGFNGLAATTSTDRSGLAASGIDPSRSVNRYHTITATGYTGGTYDITLTFDPTDVDPAAATHTADFVVRKNTGGTWTATTSGTRTATSTQATGLTGFSDFSIGEQGIDHYVVTATSPQNQGATFSTSVAAEDALNIPVSTDNTTAVTMSSNGSVEYDSNGDATFGDNSKTLTGGAFTIDTRDNTTETVDLTASDGNGKTGSRTGLVIQTPLTITTTTLGDATAGVPYLQTVAASGGTAPYTFSILIGSLPAGLAITPGTGEISGTANTAGTSDFTVQVSDAASGTATRALSITVLHAAPASLAFDVEPSDAAAGAAITPAVKLKVTDAFANPIPTELVSLSLVGTGTLSGYAPTATDANGLATFPTLSVDLAGSKQLSASTGSLGPTLSTNFTISAGAAATVAFDVEPSDAAAGAAITPAVKVKVTDAFANPVATELVSLSLVGTGTLSGYAPTATDGSGIATFSTLSVDLAGAKQLSASTSGAGPTLSTSFTISAGAAATVAFDVQPSDAAAGAAIAPAVKVKVTDAFSNPIPTELVSLSLVGTGTLSGYAPTATDGSGIATFPTLSVDATGTKQLSASTSGAGPTLSTTFEITAGGAAIITFDVEPSNAAAGAAIAPAVKVKVTDAFANPIPTELVSLSLVGTGTLSGYAPTATDGSGIATFSTLSVDLAGTKQLSASTTGAGPTLSASFTISSGAAANLTFDVQPSNTLVNAAITPAVRLKVTDAFTNPVPTELVSLSLVGTGTLSGYAPTATDGNGFATFPTLSIDQSGAKTLSASTTGLGPVLSDPFNITCPAITLSPGSLPAGTVGTAYSQTITGNGGASPYGFAVTIGSLPGGLTLTTSTGLISGTPTGSGSFNFTVTGTDAAGCEGTQAYTIVVSSSCPAIAVLPASLPSGSIAVAYSQTFTASAGTAPFTFSVTAGSLPAGLTLAPGGALTGTPTTAGVATFTIGVSDASACTGSTAYSLTILATPAAVTNLAAAQQLSGNDVDGTTRIAITFTLPPGASTAEVYRAGFGHYPKYDDAGGSVPTTPSYPPSTPWVLTAVTASGQSDEPGLRDAYHYVVFVKNAGGGVSAVSNKTAGALNYHLGDVSNGITPGQGNNAVSLEDISLLGANYGIGEPEITSRGVAYLDVGPTIDLLPTSRPTVDARVDFEDLIVNALNYQVVSAPGLVASATGKVTGPEEFRVVGPSLVEAGETVTAELWLRGGGRVQGFSARLTWDPTVVEPLGQGSWMESAQWVEGQGGVVLTPAPGVVDAALLGARETGLSGDGRVARMRFRVLRTGESGIGLERVEARDARNQRLGDGELVARVEPTVPERTLLLAPRPNPVREGERSVLEFSLATRGMVELAVFGVDGRRVRTVVRAEREPGVYREGWDGRDDGGHWAGSGVYYALLVAGPARFTQKMIVIR